MTDQLETTPPRRFVRKPGLSEVLIDGSIVIYDPETQSSHLLNHSASVIWGMIDGRRTEDEMLQQLRVMFPESGSALTSDLETALRQIETSGLTLRSGAGPPERPGTTAATPGDAVSEAPPIDDGAWPTFRGLHYSFAMSGPNDVLASLTKSLRTLSSIEPARHIYLIDERTVDGNRQLDVSVNGEIVGTADTRSVGDAVLPHVNQQVSVGSPDCLLVHASAVLTTDGVLLFSGTANAGKSTLVTGLVQAGFPYVTDEAVAVRLASLDVVAYPKPIGIDTGAHPLFPELEGAANPFAAQRWWVNPLDVGSGATSVPNGSMHTLAGIVFIRFAEGELLSSAPLSPAEAALELSGNLFNLAEHPQSGLDTLAHVVTSVPCFRAVHGDLSEMVQWVATRYQPQVLAED